VSVTTLFRSTFSIFFLISQILWIAALSGSIVVLDLGNIILTKDFALVGWILMATLVWLLLVYGFIWAWCFVWKSRVSYGDLILFLDGFNKRSPIQIILRKIANQHWGSPRRAQ